MNNFCEDHEYHYAGEECPLCKRSIGLGEEGMEENHHIDMGCDCCPGPVCSATEVRFHPEETGVAELYATGDDKPVEVVCTHGRLEVETEEGERKTVSSCDIGDGDINDDGTVSTPLTGECQALDMDTFVELARTEEKFHESSERLRHLDAIIAHAEALERLYDDDHERQVAQEMRLKAEQLRGG